MSARLADAVPHPRDDRAGGGGLRVGGPPLGLAVGALEVTTLLVVAARARSTSRSRSPNPPPGTHSSCSRSTRWRAGAGAADRRDRPRRRPGRDPAAGDAPDVLVLAPATNQPLAEWLSDLEEARFDAQRRPDALDRDAGGRRPRSPRTRGDPNPVQAVRTSSDPSGPRARARRRRGGARGRDRRAHAAPAATRATPLTPRPGPTGGVQRESGLGGGLDGTRQRPEDELAVLGVHADALALGELALEQLQRELVDQLLWITRFSGRAP